MSRSLNRYLNWLATRVRSERDLITSDEGEEITSGTFDISQLEPTSDLVVRVKFLVYQTLMFPASFLWSALMFFNDRPLGALGPFVYFFFSTLTSIYVMAFKRGERFCAHFMLTHIIALAYYMQIIQGGAYGSAHVNAWAFASSPLALIIFSEPSVVPRYVSFGILSAALGYISAEGELFPRTPTLVAIIEDNRFNGATDPMYITFELLNLIVPFVFVAVVFAHHNSLLDRMRQRISNLAELAEERAQAEHEKSLAKTRFISVVSHEIRNPLSGIILNAELMQDSDRNLTLQQRRYVSGIHRSGLLLKSVVNNVLDLGKIEAEAVELESIAFNMRELVEFVVQTMAPRTMDIDVELIMEMQPGLPERVVGDPTRLKQIIHNLSSNALKFTRRGHVLIRISCVDKDTYEAFRAPRTGGGKTSSKESVGRLTVAGLGGDLNVVDLDDPFSAPTDGFWLVDVMDTGIGIPPDGLQRLFREFSQVDTSTTRVYGGTGLGLFICKQLVGLMGGDIFVGSEEGRGSCFSFGLPMIPEAAMGNVVSHDNQDVAQLESTELTDAVTLWRLVIFVDDPALARVLEMYGQHFFATATGRVEVVVADSGKQVLRALSTVPETGACIVAADVEVASLKVQQAIFNAERTFPVAVSLFPSSEQAEQLLEDGWVTIIHKPITLSQLCDEFACLHVDNLAKSAKLNDPSASGRHRSNSKGPGGKAVPMHLRPGKGADMAMDTLGRPRRKRSNTITRSKGKSGEGLPGDGSKAKENAPLVMVVDDFDTMRELIAHVIDNAGYRTITAVNGADAVEQYEKHWRDLCGMGPSGLVGMMFCDIEMPIMDGYATTKRIRELEQQHGRPRLFISSMTANALQGDQQRVFDCGMDGFLAKPPVRAELLDRLAEHAPMHRKVTEEEEGGGLDRSAASKVSKSASRKKKKKAPPSKPTDPGSEEADAGSPDLPPPPV